MSGLMYPAYGRLKPKLHLVAKFKLNVYLFMDRNEMDSDDDVQVMVEREEEDIQLVGVVIALQPGERWIERERARGGGLGVGRERESGGGPGVGRERGASAGVGREREVGPNIWRGRSKYLQRERRMSRCCDREREEEVQIFGKGEEDVQLSYEREKKECQVLGDGKEEIQVL